MKILALVCLMSAVSPVASLAQVTQTYAYDANGRLVGVITTGASGTNTAAYGYDDADNRTSRSQTGTIAYAELRDLPGDGILRPDQALVSADGQYSFALRPSGKLELWSNDVVTQTSASDTMAAAFLLADDGQARFRPQGLALDQLVGADLTLNGHGDLVLRDRVAGTELWSAVAIQLAGGKQ